MFFDHLNEEFLRNFSKIQNLHGRKIVDTICQRKFVKSRAKGALK